MRMGLVTSHALTLAATLGRCGRMRVGGVAEGSRCGRFRNAGWAKSYRIHSGLHRSIVGGNAKRS